MSLQVGSEKCILGKRVGEQWLFLEKRADDRARKQRVRVTVVLVQLGEYAAVRYAPTEHVQSDAVTAATHPKSHRNCSCRLEKHTLSRHVSQLAHVRLQDVC